MKHSVLSIHSSVKYASMNRLTIDLILCYLKECSGHRTFEFQTLKPKKKFNDSKYWQMVVFNRQTVFGI